MIGGSGSGDAESILADPALRPALDRVTRVAGRLLQVPVAQINLVFSDRQATVSGAGPGRWGTVHEVPLSSSYCRFVVDRGKSLRVDDATTHSLVCDSPATVEGGIRAYLAVPIRLASGEIPGTICVVDFVPRTWTQEDEQALMDLSASVVSEVELRRLAQARTREMEERYRATFDEAGIGLAHISTTGRWLRVNQRLCDVLGYSMDELMELTFQEITHPDDRELDRERAGALLRGDTERYSMEKRYLRKDGSAIWMDLTASLVHHADGRPAYFIGALRDISASIAARERLRASEARFRSLFEHNPHAVFGLDLDGLFTGLNPAAAVVTGLPAEELIGRPFLDLLLPDQRDEAMRTFQLAAEGAVQPYQYVIRAHHGERTLRGAVFPMIVDGVVQGVYGVADDVTEQLQLEDRFRQAQKMEAVGQLAGGVAHDFNNILTSIKGFTTMALEQAPDRGTVRQDLEEVRRAAERASDLTRQLLTFSRKQVLRPEILDPNDLIGGLEKMLHRLIEGDVVIETALADDAGLVHADGGQLEQVIVNLALNARDAMPNGGRLVISTRAVELDDDAISSMGKTIPSGTYVMIAVADTGTGMDAKTMARIFEPFFTTKGPGKGTGLGLATVHGVVEQSGGALWVQSEPGNGSTFKVFLPAVQGQVSDRTARRMEEPDGASGIGTILVVEDDASVRRLISRVLGSRGYEVLEADSGDEALRLAAGGSRVDLVLTDVVMPGIGGRELAERLRERFPRLQVLFMSGYTEDEIIRRGITQEPRSFLEKPFSPNTLVQRVGEALSAFRA